jgi:hypothetical protein
MPTRKKRQASKAPMNGHPARHAINGHSKKPKTPESILVVDIGGTKVKLLATGETKPRKAATGKSFSPQKLVATVTKLAQGWKYDAITIGAPCLVGMNGPQSEPGNLGTGWVGFDFSAAFGKPVRVMNDAVMQALGSYEHGRMFFMGLGTGIGSALIAENVIVPMELGNLPFDGEHSISEVLSKSALQKFGKKAWRRAIDRLVPMLMSAFVADYVVLGGGNAKNVKNLPAGARLGHNLTAFRGGVRIWDETAHWTLAIPANSSKPLSPLAKADAPT